MPAHSGSESARMMSSVADRAIAEQLPQHVIADHFDPSHAAQVGLARITNSTAGARYGAAARVRGHGSQFASTSGL